MADLLLQLLLLLLVSLCAATDLFSGKIRNFIVIPIGAAGVLLRIYSAGADVIVEMVTAVLLPFPVLYFFWKRTGGKGIGGGDIKLLLCISILTPAWSVLPVYLVSFLSAGAYGICLVLRNQMKELPTREKAGEIHLAPFVALGAGLHLLGLY